MAFASVWLDAPIAAAFDYAIPPGSSGSVAAGDWVLVPWGRQQRVGIVHAITGEPAIAASRVRELLGRLPEAPRLPRQWLQLGEFAAGYYHRHPGEIMLPAIPKSLRAPPTGSRPNAAVHGRARRRWRGDVQPGNASAALSADTPAQSPARSPAPEPALTADQQQVLTALQAAGDGFAVHLLHGVTGSGKTEVYLRWIRMRLAEHPDGQILMLVPEIALTPHMAGALAARLQMPMAILHSGLSDGERAGNWLAAVDGRARIVVGTRLSVLTPLPRLRGIVVDEEHDASFKQAEGAHYSARDLAIIAARIARVPVLLGSATPALETWHSARSGRFTLHRMPGRATGAPMPAVQTVVLREPSRAVQGGQAAQGSVQGLATASAAAIEATLASNAQVLVFINRRGYAPVLNCRHCGWLSRCEHCDAWQVLHRWQEKNSGTPWRLVCHHCGVDNAVPPRCPTCGDLDLRALGQGTQRVEEVLGKAFPGARIGRLDRDVARRRGAASRLLESIHEGALDIIVGTQMLTKGHDFRRLNLVVVLDADAGLFSSDFRAPERLFATLMQVAGRAGRDAGAAGARVIVQTRFPDHPVFAALAAYDYDGFAQRQLAQRREAMLPPFSHQALLRCEAATLAAAIDFLASARAHRPQGHDAVTVYDPVPMPLARLAGRARTQLLIECRQRPALHRFIVAWLASLPPSTPRVRWQLEVDPSEI